MAARISPTVIRSGTSRNVGFPSFMDVPLTLRVGTCVTNVVTTAIVMPIMPKRLPRWLVAGDDRPRRATIKHTPATR
jgi:hypothetical protein